MAPEEKPEEWEDYVTDILDAGTMLQELGLLPDDEAAVINRILRMVEARAAAQEELRRRQA